SGRRCDTETASAPLQQVPQWVMISVQTLQRSHTLPHSHSHTHTHSLSHTHTRCSHSTLGLLRLSQHHSTHTNNPLTPPLPSLLCPSLSPLLSSALLSPLCCSIK